MPRVWKTSHDHFRCNYKVSWRAGKAFSSSSSLASSVSLLSPIQLVTIKCVIFVYAFDTFVFPHSSLYGLLSELYGLLYCHHPPPLSPISCTPKPSSDQQAVSCARAPTRRGECRKIGRERERRSVWRQTCKLSKSCTFHQLWAQVYASISPRYTHANVCNTHTHKTHTLHTQR